MSGSGSCSLGFAVSFINLQGNYEEGFVTAGHCSNTITGTEFYVQGNSDSPYGVSVWNTLPDGVGAQYVRKTGPGVDLGNGLIARPSQQNTSGQVYRDLDAQYPYFEITGTAKPIVGQTVHGVGRTTGWKSGVVLGTCEFFLNYDPSWQHLSCMGKVDYRAAVGDSGGPVFSLNPDGSATLLGLAEGLIRDRTAFTRADRALQKLLYDRGITDLWLTTDLPPRLKTSQSPADPSMGTSTNRVRRWCSPTRSARRWCSIPANPQRGVRCPRPKLPPGALRSGAVP